MNASTIRQNVSQVAKALGKGEASIRRWIQQFNIPTIEEGGQNLLSQEMVQVLLQIKELRDQKLRSEDIELNVSEAIHLERQRLNVGEASRDESSGMARRMLEDLTSAMAEHHEILAQSVSGAVHEAARMADRYAESQRELGRMEAMMQALQYQLQEAQQQARLLPEKAQALQDRELEARLLAQKLASEIEQRAAREQAQESLEAQLQRQQVEIEALRAEKTSLAQSLSESQVQLEQTQLANTELEALLESERARTWWTKLTGKTGKNAQSPG
ncbi:MAG: hypothetical protein CVV27_11350 [Candidatus Melainabacteria bacterium HGW-Melainabacteria-1]|nr:MAG: hypothetical protein CVV27_11350 [Candidatus Melainabacteria bacterium HGW-Melainabacteria-1]